MDLTFEQFKNGFALYCANLSPDFSDGCAQHLSLIERGPIRIEMRFSQALASAVTIILFCTYDNIVSVDKHRNVTTDFN